MAIGMIVGVGVFIAGIRNSNTGPRSSGIDSTTIFIGVLIFFVGALCGLPFNFQLTIFNCKLKCVDAPRAASLSLQNQPGSHISNR